ncbi:ATP-binding cassette domain-containing protein [Streptomyces sp. NPDC052236]|uniref:ISAzo13-like element transposase-related protein n=1 Tax=Streptomyces sp. NPDC052236 TaxID=3365686 RepID=UPI0037D32F34
MSPIETDTNTDADTAEHTGEVLLELVSLTKRYGPNTVLDDVSFKIHQGEVVGLLGDNGAGKSTLVKAMSGVVLAEQGDYLWRGEKPVAELGGDAQHALAVGAPVLGRVRRPGGGRRPADECDPGPVPALEALIEPREVGDPVSPLRRTTTSLRDLARELTAAGHPVSAPVVGKLLRSMGFTPPRHGQDPCRKPRP